MTCHHPDWFVVPEATAQAARRAFPNGNRSLTLRDTFGSIVTNPAVADGSDHRGRPAKAPARLALVLIGQQIAHWSAVAAAEAVRARLDWTEALALELDDSGFDAGVLSTLRARLLTAGAEARRWTRRRERLVAAGVLRARGRQRRDSPHVLAHMRLLTRVMRAAEPLRAALHDRAPVAPAWLAAHRAPAWAERYGVRVEAERLPSDAATRRTLETASGQDGDALLQAVDDPRAPPDRWQRLAVPILRQVWRQHYDRPDDARWRSSDDLPPHAQLITSPDEPEARCATKRPIAWTGDTVHLTETGDDDRP
ncbi:MAG: transposase [Roseiflexus sp.]|nr:transposase [Roseiflexus sp.]